MYLEEGMLPLHATSHLWLLIASQNRETELVCATRYGVGYVNYLNAISLDYVRACWRDQRDKLRAKGLVEPSGLVLEQPRLHLGPSCLWRSYMAASSLDVSRSKMMVSHLCIALWVKSA
jgi:hypothetical protein